MSVQPSDCDRLRAFANEVTDLWLDRGDVDGGEFAEVAMRHGVVGLEIIGSPGECGRPQCVCAKFADAEDWLDGVICHVKSELLTGRIQRLTADDSEGGLPE